MGRGGFLAGASLATETNTRPGQAEACPTERPVRSEWETGERCIVVGQLSLVILHPLTQHVGGCGRIAFDHSADVVGEVIALGNRRAGGELLGFR